MFIYVIILCMTIIMSLNNVVVFAQEFTGDGGGGYDKRQEAVDKEMKNRIDEIEGKLAGIEESYLETKATVNKLAKLKVSGYMQAQFQVAETIGVQTSMAGSKFDNTNQSKFLIRRGRIKFDYNNGLSKYVLQFDASSAGFEIKDAYIMFTEPWLKKFTGTMGIFDRPFGYEISYSSSMRESPERSRIYQTLFPKEREIGAMLKFSDDKGFMQYLNVKAGVFNGMTPLQLDIDKRKDVIGRIGFELPFKDRGMAVDGGFSGYYGAVTNTDTTKGGLSYAMEGNKFIEKSGTKDSVFVRQYMGFDLQCYYDIPFIGGLTLRGEYLWGIQPGTSSSSSFYQPSKGGAPNGSVYSRKFNGYYVYWVQCWGEKIQSVLKYDLYDPNTDVEGDNIGLSGTFTKSTDVMFKTFGAGLIYYWDANLKFMFYYDMPINEKSANLKSTDPYKDYSKDLRDNVFTLRLQYKF